MKFLFSTLYVIFSIILNTNGVVINNTLDLNVTKSEIVTLTTEEFDPTRIESVIEAFDNEWFHNTTSILKPNYFGISANNVDETYSRINKNTKEMYLILKPKDKKEKDLKNEVKSYFDRQIGNSKDEVKLRLQNRIEETYEGYLIYLVSDKNSELIEAIKSCKKLVVTDMLMANKNYLTASFGLSKNNFQDYLVMYPTYTNDVDMYIVAKANPKDKDRVKRAFSKYFSDLENKWQDTSNGNYEKVVNRLETTIGDYLIYIVSNDNERILDIIKKNEK